MQEKNEIVVDLPTTSTLEDIIAELKNYKFKTWTSWNSIERNTREFEKLSKESMKKYRLYYFRRAELNRHYDFEVLSNNPDELETGKIYLRLQERGVRYCMLDSEGTRQEDYVNYLDLGLYRKLSDEDIKSFIESEVGKNRLINKIPFTYHTRFEYKVLNKNGELQFGAIDEQQIMDGMPGYFDESVIKRNLLRATAIAGHTYPGNLFFRNKDQNGQLVSLLEEVDNACTEGAYQNQIVIKLLKAYIDQLDAYQKAFDDYKESKNSTNRNALIDTVEALRKQSEELHNLLLSQPARYATPIATFIGASLALALIPVSFFVGVFSMLCFGLVASACGSGFANHKMTRGQSKTLITVALAFATFPYYTVILGANLGHRLSEHCFFKEPKQFDEFRKQSMQEINCEIYQLWDEELKNAEADWFNEGDFDFYTFGA